jgi:hypothetical protein
MYPETSPILDFTLVPTYNPLTIGIVDTSFYPTNFSINNPSFQITPPSFPQVLVTYSPNGIGVFNSNDLNITCVDSTGELAILPDGIWTVIQTISPPIQFTLTKQFLRTDVIDQKLGYAFLKMNIASRGNGITNGYDDWAGGTGRGGGDGIGGHRESMKILQEIDAFIQCAIAAANQCNPIEAMRLYTAANIMLNNFLLGNIRGQRQTLTC